MSLEKNAIFSGLAGLAVGAGRRLKGKAFRALRKFSVKRKGEFRRGVEAGSGTTATARRKTNIEYNTAIKEHGRKEDLSKALKYGLIGAGGLAAAGGGAYLAHKILKKKREEEAY